MKWLAFRLAADTLHMSFFLILIRNIRKSKNCKGLSCKTQQLYLIIFCARYLDLFYRFSDQTLYLLTMKIGFIFVSAYLIYLMRVKTPYSETYDASVDNFRHWRFLLPGAFAASLLIHRDWTITDLIWSFSIWLEALAILPQLHMLTKLREIENITANCVGALGLSKGCYILIWIYRFYNEGYLCWTSVIAGVLQTVVLADFLYCYYFKIASFSSCPDVVSQVDEVEPSSKEEAPINPAAPYQLFSGETGK